MNDEIFMVHGGKPEKKCWEVTRRLLQERADMVRMVVNLIRRIVGIYSTR